MSLAEQITALAARIGQEIKTLVHPDHPGLARAWCSFGYENSTLVLYAAHNIAEVIRLDSGRYQIKFSTPFPDSNYCWVATARSRSSSTIRVASARRSSEDKTATLLELVCTSSSGSLSDATEINVVIYR